MRVPRRVVAAPFAPLVLLLHGCVFGESSVDPLSFRIDLDGGAAGGASAGGSGSSTSATGGAPDPSSGGAGSSVIVATGGNASTEGGQAASGGAPTGSGGAPFDSGGQGGAAIGGDCAPLPAAVCDPVKNFGCLFPFSYCDVDTNVPTKTGRCVFPEATGGAPPVPPVPAGACQILPLSSSCQPLFTCFEGTCRKLCNCDADCPSSQCCTDEGPGPRGAFKLCAPCNP